VIATEFVLEPETNSRVKKFIELLQAAKLSAERKMRRELDEKIITDKRAGSLLQAVLGEEKVKQLRYFMR